MFIDKIYLQKRAFSVVGPRFGMASLWLFAQPYLRHSALNLIR